MSILATNTPARHLSSLEWVCRRCGGEKTGKPNPARICGDCRLVESTSKINYTSRPLDSGVEGLEKPCRAWMRAFDDLDHPIHPDGTLVAPGGRLCGHSDCVEPTHTVDPDE